MALTSGVSLFRSRDDIINDLIAGFQQRIPDVYTGEDGVVRIISEVMAGVMESVFIANDILADDGFVQTASEEALDRRGDEYGLSRLVGAPSSGSVLFSGDGGTVLDIGIEVAYDPGTGDDYLYFLTTSADVIPNPGVADAPDVAINAAAGNLNGTYEYVVTFVTAAGETISGAESDAVIPVNQQVDLTNIPVGGDGTISRRIYRQKNATGLYQLVHEIADNVTVAYTDNIADGALGGSPPAVSTAERVSVTAESEEPGADYNVAAGAITVLTNAPDGVTTVTNPAPFTGATDPEGFEDYRLRLLQTLRNPQVGSASDLESWAIEIEGVDSATAYANDNEGVATNGHVTIRIAGPNGSVPDADKQAEVLAALESRDLANATLHVTTFVQTPSDVTVTLTLTDGYTHDDVDPGVLAAIEDYINSLSVGETMRVAGIYSAVFGLTGVVDLVVNTPTTNQATGATAKRTPGTITIN